LYKYLQKFRNESDLERQTTFYTLKAAIITSLQNSILMCVSNSELYDLCCNNRYTIHCSFLSFYSAST